jgi:hypothetical protein
MLILSFAIKNIRQKNTAILLPDQYRLYIVLTDVATLKRQPPRKGKEV